LYAFLILQHLQVSGPCGTVFLSSSLFDGCKNADKDEHDDQEGDIHDILFTIFLEVEQFVNVFNHDAAKRENDQITDGLAILIAVYRSILDEANSKTAGK
jgi:hypothetical protein